MATVIQAPAATMKRINGVVGLENHFLAIVHGRSTNGVVPLHGARVGDTVVQVYNMTAAADKSARFETAISVDGQIQQTNSTDNLSAANLLILLKRP